MKSIKAIGAISLVTAVAISAAAIISTQAGNSSKIASGGEYATSTTAALGYDVVSYRTGGSPVRGSGNHLSVYEGETYLFASKANKKAFDKNPAGYAPAYGGYCAYGVAVGKKFVGDPEVWKVVDDVLYLNLNTDIQKTWEKDVPGNIVKAEGNWGEIAPKSPSAL